MLHVSCYNRIVYCCVMRGPAEDAGPLCVASEVMGVAVPVYDWELHRRLNEMRERYGNHRRFYKSAAWRRLRARVLEEFHYESQDELRESPARYVRATCVHHDRFIDKWPGWALSEFWADDEGNVHRNLIPLSHDAHDKRHGRIGARPKERVTNAVSEEWW